MPIYCFVIILANPHPLSDRKALRIAWRYVFKQFIWYADSDLMSNEANAHLFIDMGRVWVTNNAICLECINPFNELRLYLKEERKKKKDEREGHLWLFNPLISPVSVLILKLFKHFNCLHCKHIRPWNTEY